MSVRSADGAEPGVAWPRARGSRRAPRRRRARAASAPLPTFTSITSASRPAASFLDRIEAVISGQRVHGGGDVADRVEAAVGGGEVGGLAHDGAAGLAYRGAEAAERRASRRIRGCWRACRACRRCGRGRGRRSSARSRRRPPRAAPGSGSPCRRRRRWSACRGSGRQGRRRTSRDGARARHGAREPRALRVGHAAEEHGHREGGDLALR